MDVSYVGSATADIGSDGSNNVPVPSGAATGDYFIMSYVGKATAITAPSGWDTLFAYADNGSLLGGAVFGGTYSGSTPTFSVTQEVGWDGNVAVIAARDVFSVQSVTSQDTSGTTSHSTGSLTPAEDGSLLVAVFQEDATTVTGTISTFTEQVDRESWGHNYIATYAQAVAASISATMTSSASVPSNNLLVALEPEAAAVETTHNLALLGVGT